MDEAVDKLREVMWFFGLDRRGPQQEVRRTKGLGRTALSESLYFVFDISANSFQTSIRGPLYVLCPRIQ